MIKKIAIFGAGGFGREVANMIEKINSETVKYKVMGFVVEQKYYKDNLCVNGYPILGDENWFSNNKDVYCVCAIAECNARERIQTSLMAQGVLFESIIALGVRIPSTTQIGCGCVIYSNCLISVNVKIGNGVLLNSCTTIGHDVNIDDFVSISPGTGISGNCSIGTKTSIGGHSYIVPRRKIGEEAVIAAGSIVFNNVKSRTTVMGNPAKRIRALEK